jgi:hypothetical protein
MNSDNFHYLFNFSRISSGVTDALSFHKERIPPFTAGVNPTLADQSTDDTLARYSTVIHNY